MYNAFVEVYRGHIEALCVIHAIIGYDLHVLLADRIEWTVLPCKGFPARYEHASFVAGSSGTVEWLYVFAGAKPDGPINDMWRLDLGM